MLRLLLPVLAFAVLLSHVQTYNILFMGPFPAPSHWMWLEYFQRDLLKKGHHVTSVNNHPTKYPHANLTEVILNPQFDIPQHYPKKDIFAMQFASDFQNLQMFWQLGVLTTEHALRDPKMKALVSSETLKFDLVIIEQYFHESLLMFAYKFKCPVVTIGTMGYADNMDHTMGLLTPWAFIPHLLLPHTDTMTFRQRAYNTYLSLYDVLMRRFFYMPRMQKMAEEHFGPYIEGPFPSLLDLEKNISLMLINSHRSVDLPRPSMPGLINVGGAHIEPAKPLPTDLQLFLDEARHGVVYFSLGSYMKSTDMPPEKTAILLKAFGQLKQRVVWKYENETIGHLPPNVMIKKWMPQNDILAHQNVKLFITHGGLFGTQEGIYWGVPMLCIPLYGDQHRNTLKSVRAGYARSMVFTEISVESLVQNIETLIQDPIYKQKAMGLSEKFRDNPIHPLDEATYWIEYIIKYKGAPHLKSRGAFMPLYQYLLLDVFGLALAGLFLIIWVPLCFVKLIIRSFFKKSKVSTEKKSK